MTYRSKEVKCLSVVLGAAVFIAACKSGPDRPIPVPTASPAVASRKVPEVLVSLRCIESEPELTLRVQGVEKESLSAVAVYSPWGEKVMAFVGKEKVAAGQSFRGRIKAVQKGQGWAEYIILRSSGPARTFNASLYEAKTEQNLQLSSLNKRGNTAGFSFSVPDCTLAQNSH